MEPSVNTTPKPSTELVIIDEQTTLNAISTVQIKEQTLAKARELLNFKINGLEDKDGYKKADDSRAKVRKLRLGVQNRVKDIKAQVRDFTKRLDDEATSVVDVLQKAENHLKLEIAKVDEEKERIKAEEARKRQQMLLDAGFKYNGSFFVAGEVILAPDKLVSYSDEELQQHVDAGKREVARIAAEQAEIARLREAAEAKARAEQEAAEKDRLLNELKKKASIDYDPDVAVVPQKGVVRDGEIVTAAQPVTHATFPQNSPARQFRPVPAPRPDVTGKWQDAQPSNNQFANVSFEIGFKTACEAVVQLLQGGEKMTRAELIQRIRALKPEDHTKPF